MKWQRKKLQTEEQDKILEEQLSEVETSNLHEKKKKKKDSKSKDTTDDPRSWDKNKKAKIKTLQEM